MTNSPTNAAAATPVTITNCDREPIHIPGAIQPYGFLLTLDPATRRVVQASANTAALIGREADSLIGQDLSCVLGPDKQAEVEAGFATLTEQARLLGARLTAVEGQPYYKIIQHQYDGLLWLEFEPVVESTAGPLAVSALNDSLGQLLAAPSLLELCRRTVAQVRAITGFDRVAIYRFAPDESGEIIAEECAEGMAPWLGLRYPGSDIPQQARAMYLKNWLRFIPDAHYAPVPVLPAHAPGANRPPDMTYAVLRSVSPIHLEYLHNLGSAATMTISLISENKLWGMITCHHRTPHLVSYELRELCQFTGKTFSALIPAKTQFDSQEYRVAVQARLGQLFVNMARQPDYLAGMYQHKPTVQEIVECSGAAICSAGDIITLGITPTDEELRALQQWADEHRPDEVFQTDSYARLNPADGPALRHTASGILGVPLSGAPGDYLFWFRPEVVQTVTWAGQNEKVQVLANGELFLSPRQSFEAWKQTVEHTSAPWREVEIEAADQVRRYVADIRLKLLAEVQARANNLGQLNTELTRSNDELDAFAYVASHDLKEPLRGIHNYSTFLLEDYAKQLDADGVHKLQTLVRLSQRMENLINSLLTLSRVGRVGLDVRETNLDELLAEVLDLLHPRLQETQTTVTVATPLPTVRCDQVRMQEVFTNLIANAMRYSDQPEKFVTVGALKPDFRERPNWPRHAPQPLDFDQFHFFYVQDQGIGIDPKHHENIFKLFKRLHGQDKYGGGTGAGLAIVKKMVEKHGGYLWVESELGAGATFYFSISKSL